MLATNFNVIIYMYNYNVFTMYYVDNINIFKTNQIKSNQIKSNQIKSNRIKSSPKITTMNVPPDEP